MIMILLIPMIPMILMIVVVVVVVVMIIIVVLRSAYDASWQLPGVVHRHEMREINISIYQYINISIYHIYI